jgi:hypothetical protein
LNIIVAGSRTFTDFNLLVATCDTVIRECYSDLPIKIIEGGAKGADALGRRYAHLRKYPVETFPAQWSVYGKAAGYKRNEQMAKVSQALIAFWEKESRGTKHMIDIAKQNGLRVFVLRIEDNGLPKLFESK